MGEMSYDVGDFINVTNEGYYKLLAEKQNKQILCLSDELTAAKLSEKALLEELKSREQYFDVIIPEIEQKKEALEDKLAIIEKYYTDLFHAQQIEMLRLKDEIKVRELLISGLYGEMEIHRKKLLDVKISEEINPAVAYWIAENQKIRDSLTFRMGEKMTAVIKNPLKIFFAPFWIIMGTLKYAKRKKVKN